MKNFLKNLFRTRYEIWRCYPVLGDDNQVRYTSGYHVPFTFGYTARLAMLVIKAWDRLAAGELYKYYSATLQGIAKFGVSNYDLGIEYRDSGAWRSYTLDAAGDTIEELLKDAVISEVDQDGGEIDCYGLEYDNEATRAATEILTKLVKT